VEFAHPSQPDTRVRADLTWLRSRWTCVFARGCRGIDATRPDDGCCTHGAHFADPGDERRVVAAARRLTSAQWQLRGVGRRAGVVEVDDSGERRTRVADGACVFLNRAGFAGPVGCALHALADEAGEHPLTTKPDVCWQLPLRREYRQVHRPDDTTYTEVSIAEFDRRGWGPGGHDLDWFCTGDPIAHVGGEPVVRSYRAELVALLGEHAYQVLLRLCEDPPVVHPASA
jgi:hypothetical protein